MKIENIKQLIEESAIKYKQKIIYKTEKEEISYQELYKRVNSLGTSLINMGLENKKIAIISENRYEWEIAYFAIICGAGVVVPVDNSLPVDEIETILKRAEIETIFCSSKYEKILQKIQKNLIEIKYIISFDSRDNNILNFNDLINQGENLIKSGNRRFINKKINANDLATIIFSSGTTEKSKAVMLSHKNICSNIISVSQVFNITEDDIALSVLPLSHALEGLFCFLLTVHKGSKRVYCDYLDNIIECIEKDKVTFMGAVPYVYEYIYENNNKLKEKLTSIKMFMSGGANLDVDLERKYKKIGINIFKGYGLTEAAPVVSIENTEKHKLGSVGRIIPNIDFKIINQDKQGVGELIIKGESVFLGYYKDEKKTKEVIKNGWLYTGDLVRIDKDGYLYINGRNKDMIVLKNGKKVFPEEIEGLLNKITGIEDSFVFAIDTEKNNLSLCAEIVCDKLVINEDFLLKEVNKINEGLPRYKRIDITFFSDQAIEKNTMGKIIREKEVNKIKVRYNL